MVSDMEHKGGLINPRPWHGQYRASFSNTDGSPKPRKRAPCQKKKEIELNGREKYKIKTDVMIYFFNLRIHIL